jgi:hypothetical protein
MTKKSSAINWLLALGLAAAYCLIAFAKPLTERLLALVMFIGLAGCGTMSSVDSVEWTAPVSTAKPVMVEKDAPIKRVEVPAAATKQLEAEPKPVMSSTSSYHHGRFTVEVKADGSQTIVGGVFTPPAVMPVSSTATHVIAINYFTKELMYYKRTEAGYKPVIGYAVVTPAPEELAQTMVRGMVRVIDTKPTWGPTKSARKLYPNLPSGILPFGHPMNAMGAVKYIIDWEAPKMELVRLHGSDGYPANFGEVPTLGCTRLENTAILELTRLLGKDAVKEGIEVTLVRGEQPPAEEFFKKDSLSNLLDLIRSGR